MKYLKQALEMKQALYSGKHSDIAILLNNIGMIYEDLGQNEEALKYLKQALAMDQALYTGNHPTIARSLNNLGLVYKALGQNQETLKNYGQALEAFKALYPDDLNHPNIQMAKGNVEKIKEDQELYLAIRLSFGLSDEEDSAPPISS